jgi:hypothetical protein
MRGSLSPCGRILFVFIANFSFLTTMLIGDRLFLLYVYGVACLKTRLRSANAFIISTPSLLSPPYLMLSTAF